MSGGASKRNPPVPNLVRISLVIFAHLVALLRPAHHLAADLILSDALYFRLYFFPVFLAQVCLVANYTLHSHSLQSTFQRSPTCGKTDNRFKGTKYVEAGQQYKKLLSLVKTDPKCKKKTKSDGKPLISMPGECSPFDLYTF